MTDIRAAKGVLRAIHRADDQKWAEAMCRAYEDLNESRDRKGSSDCFSIASQVQEERPLAYLNNQVKRPA